MKKTSRLRAELVSPELLFLMEAHDGISAKIVEGSDFKAIWASGLSISTALGVRDSNEASWTQVLEVLEYMADATSIPILMDGDTGYGNFNNVRRLVKKLCQRGIAGLCIEDKLFPKTNSFIGEGQPLADIDEFCGKIKAGKDSQTDNDFCLVARVEALISGLGLDEALKRATAYHAAGADAVLIHSKSSSAAEVLAFAQEWDDRCPLVLVPTTYCATPTERFRAARIAAIIWANHNMRAAIKAMGEVSRCIQADESVINVEDRIAGLQDVFDLTGNRELSEAEERYLPQRLRSVQALVLAASRGDELGNFTQERPKCMIDIRGRPLLRRLVSTFRQSGIRKIAVVRGYKKETVDLPTITTIDNDAYSQSGEVASLACGLEWLDGPCVISYGDILFRRYILDNLLEADGDIVLAVDALWRNRQEQSENRARDLAHCSQPFTGSYLDDEPVILRRITSDLSPDKADGEWIGLVKLSEAGLGHLRAEVEAMRQEGSFQHAGLPELFTRLLERGPAPQVVYVGGHWLDVDDVLDLAKARNFL